MNDETKRGPGRPRSPAGLTPFEKSREGLDMSEGRDPNDQVKAQRQRIPLGSGQSAWFMNYPFEHDKYYYYTFHEDGTRGGRVIEATNAFYEHCTINGENIKRPSGSGFDYLMRLPLRYHEEDLAAQRERRERIERSQNMLKENEYTVDNRGRPVFDGEALAHQSVSENPYA